MRDFKCLWNQLLHITVNIFFYCHNYIFWQLHFYKLRDMMAIYTVTVTYCEYMHIVYDVLLTDIRILINFWYFFLGLAGPCFYTHFWYQINILSLGYYAICTLSIAHLKSTYLSYLYFFNNRYRFYFPKRGIDVVAIVYQCVFGFWGLFVSCCVRLNVFIIYFLWFQWSIFGRCPRFMELPFKFCVHGSTLSIVFFFS